MHFRYTALDAAQHLVRGRRTAIDRADLEAQLQEEGEELLDARRTLPARKIRLNRQQLGEFCQQLGFCLRSGIVLQQALSDIADEEEQVALKEICRTLRRQTANGLPLADAMRMLPAAFPPSIIGIVAAGEYSGRLDSLLSGLGDTLLRLDDEAKRLRSLLLKPLLAVLLVVAASGFMLTGVVPQIRSFIGSTGLPLPWYSRALFATSDWMGHHGLHLLFALAGSALLLGLALAAQASWRLRLARLLLRIPRFGSLLAKRQAATLASLLATMYSAGIPVLEALRQTTQTIAEPAFQHSLVRICQEIERGQPLSAALANDPIYPRALLRAVRLGESTGALDLALGQYATRCRNEIARSSAQLQALIEPALTLTTGMLLGWVMLATLQPIYQTIGGALR